MPKVPGVRSVATDLVSVRRKAAVAEQSGFQVGRDAPSYYQALVGRFMTPFVDALVSATVHAGDEVLDVACGTGFATRAAAAAAGSGARVVGTDLNPAMVALARTVPDTSGADLSWSEASALELPFPDGEFDAVICQQGLQFFPDPAAGLREMARVTRGGGRIGATVWGQPEESPYLDRQIAMLARHGGWAEPDYWAGESKVREWFSSAVSGDFAIELIEATVDLPPMLSYGPEQLKSLPWSSNFFALPRAEQDAAFAELDAELAGYRTQDGIRVPFTSYLATATIGGGTTPSEM